MKKILCAERSENFRSLSQMILKIISEETGIESDVEFVNGGNELVERASKKNYDLIFTANRFYDLSGTEAIQKLRELDVKTPIIMISGDFEACRNSLKIGATDYVLKDQIKFIKNIKKMIIKYIK